MLIGSLWMIEHWNIGIIDHIFSATTVLIVVWFQYTLIG